MFVHFIIISDLTQLKQRPAWHCTGSGATETVVTMLPLSLHLWTLTTGDIFIFVAITIHWFMSFVSCCIRISVAWFCLYYYFIHLSVYKTLPLIQIVRTRIDWLDTSTRLSGQTPISDIGNILPSVTLSADHHASVKFGPDLSRSDLVQILKWSPLISKVWARFVQI